MPKPEKIAIVESTKELLEKANSIILTDYKGLTVEEDTELRRKLRESSVDYRVIKNRLARISFDELGFDDMIEHLNGPTSFAFGLDDPVAPIKVILEAGKKKDIPKIKAIWIEGRLFSPDEAQKIVDLPSKDQLISMFVGGLNAPIANFVGGLQNLIQKFVGTLAAIQNKKSED
jgi:large subunit ribosomal protein L10